MDFTSIPARFADQAARTPEATALRHNGDTITYRELDTRSDRLARHLVGLGAGPEKPVVLLMRRSPDLVVAILAVLKAGSYYVPLHSAHPAERRQRITDLFDDPLLLVDEETRREDVPHGVRDVVLASPDRDGDAVLPGPGDPDQLAYVLFTSGSTGEPKGVAVTHHNVLSLALDPLWDRDVYERCLMVSPIAFSMSTFELWVPLLHGGRIVQYPGEDIQLTDLAEVIEREKVTVVHLTAGLFRVVAEEAPHALAPLREVMTGGDLISSSAVARVLDACPDLVVRAMYGATETALFVTSSPITAPYRAGGSVPVGRPLENRRVYLLDRELRQVPGGTEGEIYIAGDGVARGYLARPDQTAERFVPDPFTGAGRRMYRTGDLGRWTADGQLELLGRADDQIKIRGFRVEPAEVEALLATHPRVRHAAVVPREVEEGDKRLIAYVVPHAGTDPDDLHEFASRHLPDYMVPAAILSLDALPTTANGKIDRAALPLPSTGDEVADTSDTDTREFLRTLFAEILGHESMEVDDNFFDLSGQSMQAIRILARIEQHTGVRVSIDVLYDNPTPALLAHRIERERTGTAAGPATVNAS